MDLPDGDESPVVLFPELPPPGLRQVHLTVTLAGSDSPVMDVVTSEGNVEEAFGMAWGECRELAGFEVRVRPLAGSWAHEPR